MRTHLVHTPSITVVPVGSQKGFAPHQVLVPHANKDPLPREYTHRLDDSQTCVLYPYRPITCRVYGIPTAIGGKTRVCGRTGFEPGKTYPIFDLDTLFRDLFSLSKELLDKAGNRDQDRASLLLSVSKAISTPLETLLREDLV